jgi:RNA exonuclease NGL2
VELSHGSGSDFNFAPDDPAYSLLLGDTILPAQEARLQASRVVHVSVDPSVSVTSPKALSEDDEGAATVTSTNSKTHDEEGEDHEEKDPDRIITNARPAGPNDGLLSTDELTRLAAEGLMRSAYDEAQLQQALTGSIPAVICGPRYQLTGRHGFHEPIWTSYTHYWKTVLGALIKAPSYSLPDILWQTTS